MRKREREKAADVVVSLNCREEKETVIAHQLEIEVSFIGFIQGDFAPLICVYACARIARRRLRLQSSIGGGDPTDPRHPISGASKRSHESARQTNHEERKRRSAAHLFALFAL